MTKFWEEYFNNIRYINPKYIDKEKLDSLLKYSYHLADDEALDNLYVMKLITKEEYQEYLSKYVEKTKEKLEYLESKRKDSEKEDFNPLMYYCCAFNSTGGPAIQEEVRDFYNWKYNTVKD